MTQPDPAKRGASVFSLLAVFALFICGAYLYWQSTQEDNGKVEGLSGSDLPQTTPDVEQDTLTLPEREPGIETIGRVETDPLPYKEMPRNYDGTGEISGEVMAAPGSDFPAQWTLQIRPSKFALARELAITMNLDFEGNQTTFEVRDLPLAAYTVQAIANNQASPPVEVALFRIEGGGPGASKQHSRLMLQFEPLSSLQVTVQDWELLPAADLPVVLEANHTRVRFEGITDARGQVRLVNLPEAHYRLFVGNPNQPLLPAQDVAVNRTKEATWSGTLPRTETVRLRVVDAAANPLPDAVIKGHGPFPIDTLTDFQGEVVLRYLPHGSYQLRASHAQSESMGKLTLPVPTPATMGIPVLIYCRP